LTTVNAQKLELKRLLELSTEKADTTVLKHLLCKKRERVNKGVEQKWELVYQYLGILRRRARWAQPGLAGLPRDIKDDDGALTLMVGAKPDTQFKVEYNVMLAQLALKSGGWLPMHAANTPIAFWRNVHATGRIPKISRAALSALSIPFANAAVERTFSQLASSEVKSRLLAGERYVQNVMMFACNRAILRDSVQFRLESMQLDPIQRAKLLHMFE